MEAEENERYVEGVITSIAFNDPKRLKKLKPKHRKVGGKKDSGLAIAGFAAAFVGGNFAGAKGDPAAFAQATGREIVYYGEDGLLRNKSGEVVARDHSRQIVVNGNPNRSI